MVYPVLAGPGKPLFDQRASGRSLTLSGSWTSASGVAVRTDRAAR